MIRIVKNVLYYKEGKTSNDTLSKLLLVKNDLASSLGEEAYLVVISQDLPSIHKKIHSFSTFVYNEKDKILTRTNFSGLPLSNQEELESVILNEISLSQKNKNNVLYRFESLSKISNRIFTKNLFKEQLNNKYGPQNIDLLAEMKRDVARDINTIRDLSGLSGIEFTKNVDVDASDLSLIRNVKVDRISLDKLTRIFSLARNLLDK